MAEVARASGRRANGAAALDHNEIDHELPQPHIASRSSLVLHRLLARSLCAVDCRTMSSSSSSGEQSGSAQMKRRVQSSEAARRAAADAAGNLSTERGTMPPPTPQLPTRAVPPHRLIIGPNAVPWTRARVVCFSFMGLVSVVGVACLLWFLVLRGSPHTESAGSAFEREQLLLLLEALVAYPTAPHQEHGIDQCVRFVSRYFQGAGMAGWFVRRGATQQAPAAKMTTLLLTTREKAFSDPLHVKVLLLAHVDSAPSPDSPLPRGPLRLLGDKGSRVYAPGVAYSKGPLAAILYALRRLPKLSDYDVGLLITSDPTARVRVRTRASE